MIQKHNKDPCKAFPTVNCTVISSFCNWFCLAVCAFLNTWLTQDDPCMTFELINGSRFSHDFHAQGITLTAKALAIKCIFQNYSQLLHNFTSGFKTAEKLIVPSVGNIYQHTIYSILHPKFYAVNICCNY